MLYNIIMCFSIFCIAQKLLILRKIVIFLEKIACDQHCLGSKPTCVILLCPWERHLMALSPAWWSWQAVLNYSNISIKL